MPHERKALVSRGRERGLLSFQRLKQILATKLPGLCGRKRTCYSHRGVVPERLEHIGQREPRVLEAAGAHGRLVQEQWRCALALRGPGQHAQRRGPRDLGGTSQLIVTYRVVKL